LKLFNRSDLERCARLALLNAQLEADPEKVVAKTVAVIAEDTPPLYTREDVEKVVKRVLKEVLE